MGSAQAMISSISYNRGQQSSVGFKFKQGGQIEGSLPFIGGQFNAEKFTSKSKNASNSIKQRVRREVRHTRKVVLLKTLTCITCLVLICMMLFKYL